MEVKAAVELAVERMGFKPFSDKQVLNHKIWFAFSEIV